MRFEDGFARIVSRRNFLTSELFRRLFSGTVGTDKPKLVGTVVDPKKSDFDSISIRIFWPDGSGPPQSVSVSDLASNQIVEQHIRH
jgi:hypothetical protein